MPTTGWILIALTTALVAWDIALAVRPPKGDTISEVVRSGARKYLMIPFAIGVLVGHWLW